MPATLEISKGIEIVELALWLKKEKVLIINDLHLGYEEVLHRKGILVPKFQIKEILSQFQSLLKKVKPKLIIINGDLKHEFGHVLSQEWKDVLNLFDFVLKNKKNNRKIIIIKGNHDLIIKPIAEKRGVTVVKEYRLGDLLIAHGDELVETDAKRIIIGHEHPAITIREGSKREKYKCFLKGNWYQKASLSGTSGNRKRLQKCGKELIVMPSFNPLLEGTDILKEKSLSPFLVDIQNFSVFITSKGEVFDFGKVRDVLERNN